MVPLSLATEHPHTSSAAHASPDELVAEFSPVARSMASRRRIQELRARIAIAEEELAAAHGRWARPSEVAAVLGVDLADVVEALAADGCFRPTSLDAPVSDGSVGLAALLGHDDREVERVEARMVVAPLVAMLAERDQLIIGLRYREELTQQEIADVVNLTQAQVSRILGRALTEMREGLAAPPPAA